MLGMPWSLNADPEYSQTINALLEGEVMAVAYSGFREGQHPDRGNGSVNPSDVAVHQDFEALDEPWKGDPDSPSGAEKHWGLNLSTGYPSR